MIEYTGVKQSDSIILMKVTSRGRPEILLNTVSEYVKKANNTSKMVWLFTFDNNDINYNNIEFINSLVEVTKFNRFTEPMSRYIETKLSSNLKDVISDKYQYQNGQIAFAVSTDKINAINRDLDEFKYISWDILLNISDDQIPIVQGYDDVIRNSMPLDLDASLWFSDGWQPRINTQEIIGYNYYKRFGYIYNPIYKSFYCDNESTLVAKKLGKLIQSPKCIIKHFHPGWDKNSHIKTDDLYRHNDQYFGSDGLIFKQREANGFT